MTEYTVVWDGAHRNAGADLLCCAAAPSCLDALEPVRTPNRHRPTFAPDSARKVAQEHARACRGALVACLAQEPMTAARLQRITGFSTADVLAGILYLRKYGQVEADVLPVAERTGHTYKSYRLVAGVGEEP